MEIEKEVKILGIDIDIFEKKIISYGAKKILDENQINILIENEVEGIIPEGSYLRIRKTENNLTGEKKEVITYKKNIENNNLRENIEFTSEISNSENMISLLKELKFTNQSIGYKHRISYILDGCRIDLDIWDKNTYPFPYAEIEVKNDEELNSIIKKLDINPENISHKSIKELQDELNLDSKK